MTKLWYDTEQKIEKRLAELQEQLVTDARMVVLGIEHAEGAFDSDVRQIKDLAQARKDLLLLEEKINNLSK